MKRYLAAAVAAVWVPAVTAQLCAQSRIPDKPFWQDYHEAHPLATAAENDVRAVCIGGGGRVGRDGGRRALLAVRQVDRSAWRQGDRPDLRALQWERWRDLGRRLEWPVPRLRARSAAGRAARRANRCGAGMPTRSSGAASEVIFAAGPNGIWRGTAAKWTRIQGKWNTAIRAIQPAAPDRLWIGTASGLYLRELSQPFTSTHYSRPNAVLSSSVNSWTVCRTERSVSARPAVSISIRWEARTLRSPRNDGLPEPLRARRDARMPTAGSGSPRSSASRGTTMADGACATAAAGCSATMHADVAIGSDGTAWVATAAGVDAIRRKRMTLAEKAAYFLQMLRARHIRPPGLVGPGRPRDAGRPLAQLYRGRRQRRRATGMYCAMESLRYAVTQAPDARENAKAAFHALMTLQQATGTRHFIARSVLPIGTPPRHEVDRTFTPQEIAESHRTDPREKIIEKRWIPIAGRQVALEARREFGRGGRPSCSATRRTMIWRRTTTRRSWSPTRWTGSSAGSWITDSCCRISTARRRAGATGRRQA